jgi:hypothetical protein
MFPAACNTLFSDRLYIYYTVRERNAREADFLASPFPRAFSDDPRAVSLKLELFRALENDRKFPATSATAYSKNNIFLIRRMNAEDFLIRNVTLFVATNFARLFSDIRDES